MFFLEKHVQLLENMRCRNKQKPSNKRIITHSKLCLWNWEPQQSATFIYKETQILNTIYKSYEDKTQL